MHVDPLLTDTQDLIGRVQTLHREIAERQCELLEVLAQLETRQAWVEDGAHDMAQWTSMALDVSRWKADRLLGAGRALPTLPATAHALARGDLAVQGLDAPDEVLRVREQWIHVHPFRGRTGGWTTHHATRTYVRMLSPTAPGR